MKDSNKDDSKKSFSLTDRLNSFRYAYDGIIALLKFEYNARIHLVILVLVIAAAIVFRISVTEWIVLTLVSGLVFTSECFNSAIEYLSDAVTREQNEKIKMAKDVAAAGVLISAIISVITGLIIFLPKIYQMFLT